MNERQLVAALRALGSRPAEPSHEFAERLWRELPRRRARPLASRRDLLLVAALLALAALALGLAVGANLLRDDQLLVRVSPSPAALSEPTRTPGPSPAATFPFTVDIPAELTPSSAIGEVEAAALGVDDAELALAGGGLRVQSMTLLAPGIKFPDRDGVLVSTAAPIWGVEVVNRDEHAVILFMTDGQLDIAGVELPPAEPGPEATITVLPTWDPAVPLELVSDGGRTIRPTLISIAPPGPPWQPGRGVAMGDILWVSMTPIYTEDPAHLVRVDTRTNEMTRVAVTGALGFGSLAPGPGRLWLSSGAELHELDPVTGEVRRSIPAPQDASLLAEGDTGLWFRIIGGAVLVDPVSGTELRRISFTEVGSHPYTGFWQPPSFGSLWDVDRGTGLLHRFDAATGASLATIQIPTVASFESCDDPTALLGVDGLPPVLAVHCRDSTFLVDPSSNTVLRAVDPHFGAFAANGQLWAAGMPDSTGVGWRWPGELARLDPVGWDEVAVLTLSRDRTAAWAPTIVGDSLWLNVGERAAANEGYDHNLALIRIPLAQLAP